MTKDILNQCDGWVRTGGAFTVGGTPEWEQCKNEATMVVTVQQETIEDMACCDECLQRIGDYNIPVLDQVYLED